MSGLPPIDQSLLPAEVRNGSAQDKKTYAAALGFERTLLNELTKSMADTAKPDDTASDDSSDDSGSSQDSATSMYMDMLPDQLANGVMQNGGLGLAQTFYDSMKGQAK
jgi:Rod binding domain-containing protein